MKLFMMCGRISGWDDDLAMLVAAEDEGEAQTKFRNELLSIDGSESPEDCEEPELYIHQTDLVGTYTGALTLELLRGYDLAVVEPQQNHYTVQIVEEVHYQIDLMAATSHEAEAKARELIVERGRENFVTDVTERTVTVHE